MPLTSGNEQEAEHRRYPPGRIINTYNTLRVALARKRQAESFCRRSDHAAAFIRRPVLMQQ